jgi:hypothetical protein
MTMQKLLVLKYVLRLFAAFVALMIAVSPMGGIASSATLRTTVTGAT